MPGIPRSSWDYLWGRNAGRVSFDERDEVEVEPDIERDYCVVCDKKSVIFQGSCLNCSSIDEKSNR